MQQGTTQSIAENYLYELAPIAAGMTVWEQDSDRLEDWPSLIGCDVESEEEDD